MEAARTSRAWERYAWAAGILYVIALLAEIVVALGVGLTQNDSAAKIASGLHEHLESGGDHRSDRQVGVPGRIGGLQLDIGVQAAE